MQKLKKIILAVSFGLLFVNPTLVLAQATNSNANSGTIKSNAIDVPEYKGVEGSITQFLCTPSEGAADGKDLERCVNKIYRFGIAFGAIALVFFVVFAGYLYITGGEQGKGKGKVIFQNALVGMALLLGSYVILYFINPNLTVIKPIQPPIFSAPDLPGCAELGLSENCIVATGTGSGASSGAGNGNIVQIAEGELGKKGAMLELNKYIATAFANNTGPEIEKYFNPGGTPGQPWCAYFATWVYGQAGIKTIGTLPGRGGTLTLNSWFKSKSGQKISEGTIRYFSSADVNSNNAALAPGDLAFYDRGTEGDPNGHTAIVIGYDPSLKKMSTIDGNQGQSDMVKRAIRDINKPCNGTDVCKLLGVGRVER